MGSYGRVVYDALVVAGGSSRRLAGADKLGLELGGRSLLEHVLAAVGHADRIVVVGPRRDVAHDVVWCQEDPVGGGPVAALAAGIGHVRAEVVVVLAGDLPLVAGALRPLVDCLAATPGADAAVLVDTAGRRNHLAAAWRAAALRDALQDLGNPADAAARRPYDAAQVVEVLDACGWGRDCDTWADYRTLAAGATEELR